MKRNVPVKGHSFFQKSVLRSNFQIAAEDFQGVENAVDMAALIAVAGIDARTDEAVADVRATLEDKGIQVIVVDQPNE